MRYPYTILALTTLIIAGFLVMPMKAQNAAQERAEKLRQQLADLQTQQTELQTRLQQVEEDLKPENIEKGLAGIGSTRPEDLREQRHRQLEIERKSLKTRLDQLAISRARLETGIAQADADAYQRSADGPKGAPHESITTQPSNSTQPSVINSPSRRNARRRNKKKPRRIRPLLQDQEHSNLVRLYLRTEA